MGMRLKYEIGVMRAWVRRREESGKNWTADELWERIKTNYPAHSDDDKEYIFQECDGNVRRLAERSHAAIRLSTLHRIK